LLVGCLASVVVVVVALFFVPFEHSYLGSLSGQVRWTQLNVPAVSGITVDVIWAVTGVAAVNVSIWTCGGPPHSSPCPWVASAYGTGGTFTFDTMSQSNLNGVGYWLWCLELRSSNETLDFTVSYSAPLIPV